MSGPPRISCHVLDTALGRPAAGIDVRLERLAGGAPDDPASWRTLGRAQTNADGRASNLEGASALELGRHRLTFETEAYSLLTGQPIFYPRAQVEFIVTSADENYHVPLLLSPFGYSTYRGS
jgi:5-hydroxyisourate hydrolase